MKKTHLFMMVGIVGIAMLLGALGRSVIAQDNGDTTPGLIVFASDRVGNSELYTLDPETGQIAALTDDPGNDIDPQWSPDGSQIIFASDRDGDYEIFVLDVPAADTTDSGAATEEAELAEPRQLTNNEQSDVLPKWQPNGTWVVYVSDVNGQWDIYAINVESGMVRQITNDEADERGLLIRQAEASAPPPAPVTESGTPAAPTTQAIQSDGVVNSTRLNVRANPGEGATILTALAQGDAVDIIGRYSDNSWLQVITPTNVTGWVFAQFVTVNINLTNIPVVNAIFSPAPTAVPPTPIPQATAPAATTAPAGNANVNLVAGVVVLNPAQPTCGQTFTVGFDVANLGSEASAASSTVSLVDSAQGGTQGTTIGGFPVLQPGQTFRVDMPLTISTWYDVPHTITLSIDPNNQIPEANRADNTATITYTLAKGSCP